MSEESLANSFRIPSSVPPAPLDVGVGMVLLTVGLEGGHLRGQWCPRSGRGLVSTSSCEIGGSPRSGALARTTGRQNVTLCMVSPPASRGVGC